MKLLVITDLHLSTNKPGGRIGDYIADVDEKLDEVVLLANKYAVEGVLCGGDVFHRPDVAYLAITRFILFLEKLNKPFITIAGSHDLFGNNYDALGRTAIGVLDKLNCITLLRPEVKPTITIGGFEIGIAGSGVKDIELVHGAVLPSPDFGEYTLLSQYKSQARLVIVGHYHSGYELNTVDGHTFICPGSLVRTVASTSELIRRPRAAIITDTYEVVWEELKSAKEGIEVLSPPIVVPKLDFSAFIKDWKVDDTGEEISATDLLTYLAKADNVSKSQLDFALSYLEERKYESRG